MMRLENIIFLEIFGPVMNLIEFKKLDSAIDFINKGRYGNMACVFTKDGLSRPNISKT